MPNSTGDCTFGVDPNISSKNEEIEVFVKVWQCQAHLSSYVVLQPYEDLSERYTIEQ